MQPQIFKEIETVFSRILIFRRSSAEIPPNLIKVEKMSAEISAELLEISADSAEVRLKFGWSSAEISSEKKPIVVRFPSGNRRFVIDVDLKVCWLGF